MKIYILAILFVLLAACSQQVGPTQAVPAPGNEDVEEIIVIDASSDKESMADEEVMVDTSVREIRVIAKRWRFTPDPIEVDKGENIRLILTSVDVTHGFKISTPFLDINERVEAGKEVSVDFTATEIGEWTFRCSVVCGSGHSTMNGKLVVK